MNIPEDNYRIVFIDNNNKKVEKLSFYADNDSKAYSYLKKYQKINKDHIYYWDIKNRVFNHKGEPIDISNWNMSKSEPEKDNIEFEIIINVKNNGKLKHSKKLSRKIKGNFKIHHRNILKDLSYFLKNYDCLNRSSHLPSESFSLDIHIMNDILFNIEILKKDVTGIPNHIIEKAKKIKSSNHEDIFNEAVKLRTEELEELSKAIKLYFYYISYGIDYKDEFIDKPLPIKKGSYDLLDYTKIVKLTSEAWESWIKIFQNIGQSLWT